MHSFHPPSPVRDAAPLHTLRERLGPEQVWGPEDPRISPAGRAVCGRRRRLGGLVRPADEAEVREVLAWAAHARWPIYPYSTGMNWGLGSRLPVVDGAVLLDLSRMNRIIAVEPRARAALIEPGVTQAQLADHLATHHPELTFNVTGSFAHSGIVGNVLDRGDGVHDARVDDLLGAAGFWADGRPMRVGGFGELTDLALAHGFPRGVGPDLRGLVTQSNLAVVTRLAFRLLSRPERIVLVTGQADDARLEAVVDALDRFCAQAHLARPAVGLGYVNRFQAFDRASAAAARLQEPVWTMFMVIRGLRGLCEAITAAAHERLGPLLQRLDAWPVVAGEPPPPGMPPHFHPLLGPLVGVPDDHNLQAIYGALGAQLPDDPRRMNPDDLSFGMRSLLPVVLPVGDRFRRAAEIVAKVSSAHGFTTKLGADLSGRGLVTVYFDRRDPAEVDAAAGCVDALRRELFAAGFPLHRAALDEMAGLVDLLPEQFAVIGRLKALFDPAGILAPGRYAPATDDQAR